MNNFADVIKGKNVLVFGLGRQGGGQGDAAWLTLHGANVRLSDQDLTLVPTGQSQADIDWADYLIKNPAVPDDHTLILSAQAKGIPVLTSAAVFVKYSPIPVIAVTGTRGKSTTTALITTMLELAYPGQVISGGNIPGTSGLALFDQLEGKRYAVLELSSFQLHNFHNLKISPQLAVITNLYPDHLNRYQNMDSYLHDKAAIVAYQKATDLTFVNSDNSGALAIAKSSKGRIVPYSTQDIVGWETKLRGLHNRENIAASVALCKNLGIPEDLLRQVVRDFSGLPYRLEQIRVLAGITYLNDTTATSPTASIKALESITSPVIWITGGASKNLPFTELISQVGSNQALKKIVILGSQKIPDYTSALRKIAGDKIVGTATSMSEAVTLARSVATSGDTILLSPGFSSFDLFQNEFDRGRQFTDIVNHL